MACAGCFASGPELKLNLDRDDDPSHGVDNDITLAEKRSGLWVHRKLMTLARNAVYGPYGEHRRWCEMMECIAEAEHFIAPESCPFWRDAVPQILEERGEESRMMEADIAITLWKEFVNRRHKAIGQKYNPARFLSDHYKGVMELRDFTMNYSAMYYTCSLLGISKLDALAKNLKKFTEAKAAMSGAASDSMKANDVKLQALKHGCKVQLEIALVVFGTPETKYVERLLLAVRTPWAVWHERQNRHPRSIHETISWELEQINGQFFGTMRESFRAMHTSGRLNSYGFKTDFQASTCVALDLNHPLVQHNQQLAHILGTYSVNLNFLRYKRVLGLLRGWPKLIVACLCPERKTATVKQFKQDWENFKALETSTNAWEVLLN